MKNLNLSSHTFGRRIGLGAQNFSSPIYIFYIAWIFLHTNSTKLILFFFKALPLSLVDDLFYN